MKNFDAFKDLCYKTIFTESMKEKILRMVEENYVDDIEAENLKNMNDSVLAGIVSRKKKSLEFLNVHVKAMIAISFGIKILSFIINHFAVMRSVNIQKNIDVFYRFYIDMFSIYDFDFNIYNKIYTYIENKVNSSWNFNSIIFLLTIEVLRKLYNYFKIIIIYSQYSKLGDNKTPFLREYP